MSRIPYFGLFRVGLGVVGMLFMVSGASASVVYTVTDLDVLIGPGAMVAAINNGGKIVGNFMVPGGYDLRGFVYTPGGTKELRILEPAEFGRYVASTSAYAINEYGAVTGIASDGNRHIGFIYDNGFVRYIWRWGTDTYFHPAAINNRKQVVGMRTDSLDDRYLAIFPGGEYTTTKGEITAINNRGHYVGSYLNESAPSEAFSVGVSPALPGDFPWPMDINDRDQIVGGSYLYDHGKKIFLGTVDGFEKSGARRINKLGEIVGDLWDGSNVSSGRRSCFVWSGGVMQDLNDLIPKDCGWVLEQAADINDWGVIIGKGYFHGEPRSFLLTPVPEPGVVGGVVVVSVGLQVGRWHMRKRTRKDGREMMNDER